MRGLIPHESNFKNRSKPQSGSLLVFPSAICHAIVEATLAKTQKVRMPGRHNSTKESRKYIMRRRETQERERANRVGDEEAIGGL